mgnify:CR=1 FL=1
MNIPPVTRFRVPLLQLLGDGQERPLAEAANALADVFKLTEEERRAVLREWLTDGAGGEGERAVEAS